ncbi:toprim domain-containing protein, partial [Klebsiella pneumoniae]|uniref:toprim domain-containing protein n=1 Tax=Klebsiella pneumoniae TaxID=573 RepID=UPI003B97D0C3
YEKRYYLYGLTHARKAIREKGYAMVFEGYTDVIIAHQSGLENSIATCGTAFTREQMEKLKKITSKLVFWYDGDSSGFDAMM